MCPGDEGGLMDIWCRVLESAAMSVLESRVVMNLSREDVDRFCYRIVLDQCLVRVEVDREDSQFQDYSYSSSNPSVLSLLALVLSVLQAEYNPSSQLQVDSLRLPF